MKKAGFFVMIIIQCLLVQNSISAQVVMNEIYSRGTSSDPDWIELYNAGTADVDLSGYKIYDSGGNTGSKAKKEIPSGTVISAGGFYVVITDGSNSEDFGLSSSGEEVWLENASGSIIDDAVFPALETTQSYARIGDGGTWTVVTNITKGSSNGTSTDIDDVSAVSSSYKLYRNYPNPFNPTTVLSYEIPSREFVQLTVYDILGNEIEVLVQEEKLAGVHSMNFSATNLASGCYLYVLKAGNYVKTEKMLLLK